MEQYQVLAAGLWRVAERVRVCAACFPAWQEGVLPADRD